MILRAQDCDLPLQKNGFAPNQRRQLNASRVSFNAETRGTLEERRVETEDRAEFVLRPVERMFVVPQTIKSHLFSQQKY